MVTPIDSESEIGRRFALMQRLKSFNYGQLPDEAAGGDAGDASQDALADRIPDYSTTPDIFDRGAASVGDIFDIDQQRGLWEHLRTRQAAILDSSRILGRTRPIITMPATTGGPRSALS